MSFRYLNTNYFLIPGSTGKGLLAFDAGWPCSLHDYARAMKTTGSGLKDIEWAVVSHFHLDHAGLIGEFQGLGITCIVLENQMEAIDQMEELVSRKYRDYRRIRKEGLLRITTAESRDFLAGIGVAGEVVPTPGHSDDCVSLITDTHQVLIGDLYPVSQLMDDDVISRASWDLIRVRGGEDVFPSHAEAFTLEPEGSVTNLRATPEFSAKGEGRKTARPRGERRHKGLLPDALQGRGKSNP